MASQQNDSSRKSTKLRPAPYSQPRVKINKTTFAAWITGIAGTLMLLLLINPAIMSADLVASEEQPALAQNLLPTVTPTPASSVESLPAKVDAPAAQVAVEQISYPVPTPMSFSARAQFAITQTAVVSLSANLRSGPGKDYDRAGGVHVGDTIEVIDCDANCDWYELPGDKWVAAWLVDVTRGESTLLAASPSNELPEAPARITWGVVTAPMLNVRVGPGETYAVADFRAEGSCIPLLAAEDNWVQVPLSHDTSGWAVVDYVETVSACPSTNGQMVISPQDPAISAEPSDAS